MSSPISTGPSVRGSTEEPGIHLADGLLFPEEGLSQHPSIHAGRLVTSASTRLRGESVRLVEAAKVLPQHYGKGVKMRRERV